MKMTSSSSALNTRRSEFHNRAPTSNFQTRQPSPHSHTPSKRPYPQFKPTPKPPLYPVLKKQKQSTAQTSSPTQQNQNLLKCTVPITESQLQTMVPPLPSEMIDVPTECSTCKVSCMSKLNYEQHCRGKKHKAKVEGRSGNGKEIDQDMKKHEIIWCKVCTVYCVNEFSMAQHLSGKRHLQLVHLKGKVHVDSQVKEEN